MTNGFERTSPPKEIQLFDVTHRPEEGRKKYDINDWQIDWKNAREKSIAKTRSEAPKEVLYNKRQVNKMIFKTSVIVCLCSVLTVTAGLGIYNYAKNDYPLDRAQNEVNEAIVDQYQFGMSVKGNGPNIVWENTHPAEGNKIWYDNSNIAKYIIGVCKEIDSIYDLNCCIYSTYICMREDWDNHNIDAVINYLSSSFEENTPEYVQVSGCKSLNDYLMNYGYYKTEIDENGRKVQVPDFEAWSNISRHANIDFLNKIKENMYEEWHPYLEEKGNRK